MKRIKSLKAFAIVNWNVANVKFTTKTERSEAICTIRLFPETFFDYLDLWMLISDRLIYYANFYLRYHRS